MYIDLDNLLDAKVGKCTYDSVDTDNLRFLEHWKHKRVLDIKKEIFSCKVLSCVSFIFLSFGVDLFKNSFDFSELGDFNIDLLVKYKNWLHLNYSNFDDGFKELVFSIKLDWKALCILDGQEGIIASVNGKLLGEVGSYDDLVSKLTSEFYREHFLVGVS